MSLDVLMNEFLRTYFSPISAVDPFISLSIAAGHLTGDSGEPTPSPFLHLLHQAAAAPPWAQSVSALISWNRVIMMSDIGIGIPNSL